MRFENEFEFLSNFSKSEIVLDGIIYPTVEHSFQAMKTKDPIQRAEIAAAPTPGKAKRLGRHVQLRSDWEKVKDQCMLDALRLKFADEDLGYKLQETGDKWLEEGNDWHDNYWGVCHCIKCQDIMGKNHLGKLLMKVRKEMGHGERNKKWHIWNNSNKEYPLCWDDRALEFDTKDQALEFLHSAIETCSFDDDFWKHNFIDEDILYYDGGYINASNMVAWYHPEKCNVVLAIRQF